MTIDAIAGADGILRCPWAAGAPEFPHYHDTEWGRPVGDDDGLFERLSLEAFQAGLSWRTILTKRENFRAAFAGFEIDAVAAFGPDDVERLLGDAGIVRHRGKIEAVINNAQRAIELAETEGSLSAFVWAYEPDPAALAEPQSVSLSAESTALSKELKGRGWKFVGPTTVYSLFQALALVNDHVVGCVSREVTERRRNDFRRPQL